MPTPQLDTPPIKRKPALKKQSIATPPSSSHATPLRDSRSTNIMNDDAAERANRRKSAHFGDLPSATSSSSAGGGDGRKDGGRRVVSALAVQAQAGSSSGMSMAQKKAKRLSAVGLAPLSSMDQVVPGVEVNNEKFEEWMKLATDNKITATNTWNFALIDYFADLTLLRNDEDQSKSTEIQESQVAKLTKTGINFQKASCTLDGCVKVWTSRVDSVATETGKLLSGLAGGNAEEDEEGDGDEDEEGGEPRKTRKATHRSEATLAKSFDTLKVKKFDLEFTVDPLFKKTCADFDEGGAMGLLMNHLSVDGKGRVVFDAGDAVADEEEEEEKMEEDPLVDLSKLRAYMPTLGKTMGLEISDTLSSFRFSSDPESMPDFASLIGLKDSFADDGPSGDYDDMGPTGEGETEDFFGNDDYDAGGGGGYDDGASAGGYDDEAGYSGAARGVGMAAPGDMHAPFDPRRQGGELVMALAGSADEDGMFDYFDKGFGKNWAGAEHWKLRKVSRKDPTATTATKTAKMAKTPFTIDFTSPSTSATSSKVLFAPATRASISLPSAAKPKRSSKKRSSGEAKKRKEEWLLPDDMHFSSRQLLRLFLKPKFALRMRKNTAARATGNANGEIDESFWAQAAADRAEMDESGGGDDMGDGDDMPMPFESQFFHDDGDDGYDGGPVMDHGDEDDLWQGTQGQELKKARPDNVHFAKKAKRVDVKRLKDDIWTGLRGLVPEPLVDSMESDEEMPPPATPEPVKTFDSIIQNLRTTYPQEKMSEISTSFCFICLLHLANEEGLKIETGRYDGQEGEDVGCMGMADDFEAEVDDPAKRWKRQKLDRGEKEDRVVGELQALKVFKDLTAGRAA